MPPQRRPAAALPVRAARGRGLKRPAGSPREEESVEEVINAWDITLDQRRDLQDVEVVSGTYWEAPAKAVIRVQEVYIRNGELYLKGPALGTQSESLLRAATERENRVVDVHLCPQSCSGGAHAEGVLHARILRRLGAHREAWMSNMLPAEKRRDQEDDLAEIRADQARMRGAGEESRGVRDGAAPPGDSSDEKKEKKKAKHKKKKRKDWKVEGQKEISAIFKHTGADPDPGVRRTFRKRAAKLARKKGRDLSSSGSSSSTSFSSQARGEMGLFGAAGRVQAIAKKLPGTLAAGALEEIAESLVTQDGGLWEVHSGQLPPLYLRYFKSHLSPKMSPAMAREAHTLCHAMDLMTRGRVAESLDLCSQRVKALEMMMGGCHFTAAQQQALLPREGTTISMTSEFQEAARRAREDGKARAEAARPYGSRGAGAGKSDDWQKGGGKKGDRKGKPGKSDYKKHEGDKADPKKGKGS